MLYFVIAQDGSKYGPADLATLNLWIQEGRLFPSTLLEEEGSGARIAASAVSGLTFPSPGPGVPGQGSPYAQPPAMGPTGPAMGYQPPDSGKTETVISWILGGLGILCCGLGGWLFSAIGIGLAVAGKKKGSAGAQVAMIFNIVVLAGSLLSAIFIIPAAMHMVNTMQNDPAFQKSLGSPRPLVSPQEIEK